MRALKDSTKHNDNDAKKQRVDNNGIVWVPLGQFKKMLAAEKQKVVVDGNTNPAAEKYDFTSLTNPPNRNIMALSTI